MGKFEEEVKKLVPNPEFEEAELEMRYFDSKGQWFKHPGISVRRWRMRDKEALAAAMLANDNETLNRLEVLSHIAVDEAEEPRQP